MNNPPIYIGDWEKINDFQYRHRFQRNSFIDIVSDGIIYYDTTKVDIRIPILTFTKNPITAPYGYALLGEDGKIKKSQIPEKAITNTYVVIDEDSMLTLEVEQGDIAIRTDLSKTFILREEPANIFANWEELKNPLAPVQSVAGRTGSITLSSNDLSDNNFLEKIANKNNPNGYAGLDSNGKLPKSRLYHPSKFLGEKFYNEFYIPISSSFPAICLSRLSDSETKTDYYSSNNIPILFPLLQSEKWKFGNTDQIEYSSYTIAEQTIISLTAANNDSINDLFLKAVVEMIYMHNALDRGTTLVAQNYADLDLVVFFNGVYSRLIGFNLINRTITLDYSTIGQTSSMGNIEIYPYRLSNAIVDHLTKIQIRKLPEETTFASGYNSGMNLEHRFQGHAMLVSQKNDTTTRVTGASVQSGSGVAGIYRTSNVSEYDLSANIIESDNENGTPNFGRTTRSNQSQSKAYMWAEVYNA